MHPIIVTTTCDSEAVADSLVEKVLQSRLAACIQVSGPVRSSYWWNERIASDSEYIIQMKSEKSLFNELAALIRSVHPYDVPEIVATDMCLVEQDYLDWMQKELEV